MKRRRSDKINRQETAQRRHASELVRRKKAHLLIDGYNLMHVTRFKPLSDSAGELRGCREGLLSMLAELLSTTQYKQITVVFDSENAPLHLPDQISWQHLDIQFARKENTADDLIVALIRQHASPKQLVVVSGDHRIHAAAGKRVAVVDSDLWWEALLDNPSAQSPEEPRDGDSEPIKERMSAEELDDFRKAMTETTEASEFDNPFPQDYLDDIEDEDI